MDMPHGAILVVADGQKYMLLRNHGDAAVIDLRVTKVHEIDNPPTREQGTDRPGRMSDPDYHRSAVQTTDWHELEEERFAKDLAEKLNTWALADRLPPVVLAADPETLGTLRSQLHRKAREQVLREIGKDLTNHPVEQIEAAILEL